MYVLEGQEATKLSEDASVSNLAESAISYQPPTLTSDIFAASQPTERTVPHLKDLIHICLDPEVHSCGMTFNMFYVGSMYPYFISYRGKWVYLFAAGVM